MNYVGYRERELTLQEGQLFLHCILRNLAFIHEVFVCNREDRPSHNTTWRDNSCILVDTERSEEILIDEFQHRADFVRLGKTGVTVLEGLFLKVPFQVS